MIAFKDGVRLDLASTAIRHLVDTLDTISRRSGVLGCLAHGDLTITSGNDSAHAAGSRHYRDEAIDIRAHNIKPDRRAWFREYYEAALNASAPGRFRVLHEHVGTPKEHFHAQVAIGQVFP